jgi:hypothetical protein
MGVGGEGLREGAGANYEKTKKPLAPFPKVLI